MPDRRKHRGPHPEDDRLFSPDVHPLLREAASDLRWMLNRGYAQKSALKLVGDSFDLVARQRTAVARCVCSQEEAQRRQSHLAPPPQLSGQPLWLDGYNVLTTVEAALAGGVVLGCCDGTYRDMASMHGSFRKVEETPPAIELIGRVIESLDVASCCWCLDRPVSNSGRLKAVIEQTAEAHGWPWQVELVADPDAILVGCEEIIATADSAILDQCNAWYNLAREVVDRHVPRVNLMNLAILDEPTV